MSLESTLFGLPKDTEIVFLTPQAAAKLGASSGYNAVHKVGDRVRYELLKAGKTIGEASATVAKQEEPAQPTAPKQEKKAKKEVVKEEPAIQKAEEVKTEEAPAEQKQEEQKEA